MDSIRDIGKNESKWLAHYNELLSYVEEHHQLPDKKKPDNRNLLNWWKYNRKCIKAGKLNADRLEKLRKINEMRYERITEF
ncbi:helicase associated domain-containing protein [uncultured Prevotella sp.]|uniref:helicase associated domain-containing protein n=1 Tax=uncultured Prevotella sp. TaxID=159272 RepID=UPI0026301AC9|nr:helicase associated domain-containing protein [uncultured Prevotella sp.]